MFYVYVIESKIDGNWYTGFTPDLRKRIALHNEGKVLSTKERAPFELLYYEASHTMLDARARERYLKSGMGKRYIKNRLKHYFSEGWSPLEMASDHL